MFASLLRS